MNPYIHSKISVKKWGGKVEDYEFVHKLIDCTKDICSDNRHRFLHTHWGINHVIIPIVGDNFLNSDNKNVNVKDLCEHDHILPDYRQRFIPTLSDFVDSINENQLENWKSRIEKVHQQYAHNQKIKDILLSPLKNTGKLKSLLLTHNNWFVYEILPKITDVEIQLEDFDLTIAEVMNTMTFEMWMDNGATYPRSAKKIEKFN